MVRIEVAGDIWLRMSWPTYGFRADDDDDDDDDEDVNDRGTQQCPEFNGKTRFKFKNN